MLSKVDHIRPIIPTAMKNNLSTLSILHYVYGGLTCFAGLFMLLFIGVGTFLRTDMVQQQPDAADAAMVGGIMQGLGAVLFVVVEVIGVLIILSGRWIKRRVNRTGSLVIAGFCCLSFPFGTALGIFTFVTLLNDEVRREYEGQAPAIV